MSRVLQLAAIIGIAGSCGLRAEEIRFNHDIRPIFLKHCTSCHGGVKEAGGISFVYRERLVIEGESGHIAVVPGKPAESELIKRIKSSDPDEIMPKPKHGPPLSTSEIATLERWIAEGAKWEEHWAFEKPVERPPGKLKHSDWPSMPLDQYVLSGIEQAGLEPSPPAAPGEWLRRVSFDLTGLPPTPDQLATLETDWKTDDKSAREKTVDRLLASPAYGERWASVWLDLARYADTYGFEKDPERDIWPWRDCVIRAFNQDKPYDRFTIEQLAGDLLPEADAETILATAFHRNTQTNTEGGTDDEEFRVAAVIDRISTVWTTWQATTFACVQCHSHPYDPITHDEFYEFMAFFDNTEDSDLNDDFPKLKIADGDPNEWLKLNQENIKLRAELNHDGQEISGLKWQALSEMLFNPDHGTLTADESGLIISEGNLRRHTVHRVSGTSPPFDAIRLSILPKSDDPKSWPELGALVTHFELDRIGEDGSRTPVKLSDVIADKLIGPFDPVSALIRDGVDEDFKRFETDKSESVGASRGMGEFPRLSGPREFIVLPSRTITLAPGERIEVSMKQSGNANESQGTYLRKFRLETVSDSRIAALTADPKRTEKWQKIFANHDSMQSMNGTEVPVVRQRPENGNRETRVFARGNRIAKEHLVTPDVPELLRGKFAETKDADRLQMAQWMVSPENPLTARVMVNRLWAELFGHGISESLGDFGTSGALPTNLALLDHLALRFQNEQKWSIKSALREMVLSSTYLQASNTPAALQEKDPKNQLLARGPRNRLTAEMVRDQALSVSGLLSPKMFGAPVFPPQPDGVWNSVYSGAKWEESKGEDRVRRAIYTYIKRTSGFPGFLTFDAPSRDICSPQRIVSNTPLQALVTMNDPAHMEAAAALAKRMLENGADLRAQLAFGILATTQIHADDTMLDELESLHSDLEKQFQADPTSAENLGPDAAMTLTANTILNLDAALTR